MKISKINQEEIAGVVILYNSSLEVINNISTYIDQVQTLYVVDNSTVYNDELMDVLLLNPKVLYHSFNGNKGIAEALNWASKRATKDGFAVLLTMDDDTRAPSTMVTQMIAFWNQYDQPIGILSGVHHYKPATLAYKRLFYTLTSGNLLNLNAYRDIGDFRNDFFIDHVDHDFGFRLNHAGYHVIELQDIHLDHKLGYSDQIKLGSLVIRKYGTNSPIRLYYYARNGIYVARTYFTKHPDFAWMFCKEMTRRWIKTLFLDKNRALRLNMLVKGVKDGWQGHLGMHIEE